MDSGGTSVSRRTAEMTKISKQMQSKAVSWQKCVMFTLRQVGQSGGMIERERERERDATPAVEESRV